MDDVVATQATNVSVLTDGVAMVQVIARGGTVRSELRGSTRRVM